MQICKQKKKDSLYLKFPILISVFVILFHSQKSSIGCDHLHGDSDCHLRNCEHRLFHRYFTWRAAGFRSCCCGKWCYWKCWKTFVVMCEILRLVSLNCFGRRVGNHVTKWQTHFQNWAARTLKFLVLLFCSFLCLSKEFKKGMCVSLWSLYNAMGAAAILMVRCGWQFIVPLDLARSYKLR